MVATIYMATTLSIRIDDALLTRVDALVQLLPRSSRSAMLVLLIARGLSSADNESTSDLPESLDRWWRESTVGKTPIKRGRPQGSKAKPKPKPTSLDVVADRALATMTEWTAQAVAAHPPAVDPEIAKHLSPHLYHPDGFAAVIDPDITTKALEAIGVTPAQAEVTDAFNALLGAPEDAHQSLKDRSASDPEVKAMLDDLGIDLSGPSPFGKS